MYIGYICIYISDIYDYIYTYTSGMYIGYIQVYRVCNLGALSVGEPPIYLQLPTNSEILCRYLML